MSEQIPSAVLAELRDEIRATLADFGVSAAGVFGSTARGEDRAGSDLDLIVEFEPGRTRDLVRLADALSTLTGLHVDVVDHEAVFARAAATGIGTSILHETVPL
ncbi:nucleotidyltransferase domain-containing protein [Georgenia sp. TF02-10]|uniref:nucleotidyltransferase family protein n=1 Tax=Georgenia sp. TF02-10 TaxID=2917725 RepID=UPI001FA79A16|nr:nucleotidyltransferase domain-containing protein [Georgenia sp. TF02-10]UNX55044.1 nucleotidyltransferase domain-containing protein [Georgenia sp. TF02-10]